MTSLTRGRAKPAYLSSWVQLEYFVPLVLLLAEAKELVAVALKALLLKDQHSPPARHAAGTPVQEHVRRHCESVAAAKLTCVAVTLTARSKVECYTY